MTKKELLAAIADLPDDCHIWIELDCCDAEDEARDALRNTGMIASTLDRVIATNLNHATLRGEYA